MSRCLAALAGLALAFVPGCSLQPTYVRPAAPVAGSFPGGPAYQPPQHERDTTLQAVDIGWRDFLRDARLQRLMEIALANNRDLRVAALNVEQVRAQYRIQRAAPYPQVGGFADGSRSHTPAGIAANGQASTTQTFEVGVSASWEIDFFGRLRSLNDAALQQYFASQYARQATQILLVSQVADQYLTLLALDEELEVTRRTAQTAQASFDIVKLQFDTGTGTELALRQAQTVVELAQATYAAQVRGRAQAENALELLVGAPLPADLPPPVRLGAQQILADVPEGLPSDLLARRPDILQAEAVLRAENANIGAARAAFFPTIRLTGNAGTSSTSLSGLFDNGTSAWSLVPSITVPIFNAGALDASLDAAQVQKDIGVAQYEKAIQAAFREVSDGLAARGTYDDEVAADERYTAAQERALELSDFRYRNGVDSYLTVLTAQTGYYNAQLALVSARLARLTNLVDLYRALGGGWIQSTGDLPVPVAQAKNPATRPR
ncbi:MAG TPA: efflux transporter outer membrane subunit [Usitatibacter sp.]|nr:efflux transporter outer membrane subunit [Usitatibacter sp.]